MYILMIIMCVVVVSKVGQWVIVLEECCDVLFAEESDDGGETFTLVAITDIEE